ncbi:MAG: rhodanese-like domain-containing protein [Gemmatimonadaceae bacterium]
MEDEVQSSEAVHIDDVPVEEAWARLEKDPGSVLIDVRTRAEWTFVGLPDLGKIGKRVLTVEWQTSPDSKIDAGFPERLTAVLDAAGATKDSELLFICRSGARSRMAAEAMAGVGYRQCRNVADGFEGPLDASRHRGQVAGWKAAGLSWVQG